MLSVAIVCLFVFAVIINCGYAFYFFLRIFQLPTPTNKIPTANRQKVSIIICAKNEAANLINNLPHILNQEYHDNSDNPLFEVIVINDGSTDSTSNVVQQFAANHPNLKVLDLPQQSGGKKAALLAGIDLAQYHNLLLTDADCKPQTSNWLEQMVTPLHSGKEIVVGYSGYTQTPALLNAFIRWETIHTFLQYATYTHAGLPYMAVGRNLACKKAVFQKVATSKAYTALPYGDDDILVSIAGTKANTAVVFNHNALTYSDAVNTLKAYIHQKQRHLSTGKYYKPKIKLLIGTYGLMHALTWLTFFALQCTNYSIIANYIMLARCAIVWFTWIATAIKTNEKQLIYFMPLFDIGWMIYNFAFSPYIFLKNKRHWK